MSYYQFNSQEKKIRSLSIKIQQFAFTKMHSKIPTAKNSGHFVPAWILTFGVNRGLCENNTPCVTPHTSVAETWTSPVHSLFMKNSWVTRRSLENHNYNTAEYFLFSYVILAFDYTTQCPVWSRYDRYHNNTTLCYCTARMNTLCDRKIRLISRPLVSEISGVFCELNVCSKFSARYCGVVYHGMNIWISNVEKSSVYH